MDIESRIDLVCRPPAQEVVTREDLREIFETVKTPKHYIGFEISGKVHIGSGLMTMLKIEDMIKAGVRPTIFLADYHAWINGKLGGDLATIQDVAKGYFKHAFISLGLDESRVDYVLASECYTRDYWATVLNISRTASISRILRTITIMGRKDTEATNASAIVYPAMQAADIAFLNVDIAHAGMDQRKVHMFARESFPKLGFKKFAAVHGRLLPGLGGMQRMDASKPVEKEGEDDRMIDMKMSKSSPSSAIFIHDSEADIKAKISKAYCPEKTVEGNPVIEYAECLCLSEGKFKIERPAKYGGDMEFATADELKAEYSAGKIHPMDLKNGVAAWLCKKLAPSREYFAKNPQYMEQIEKARTTR
jgi:tyrosyl-tRNA synthetase